MYTDPSQRNTSITLNHVPYSYQQIVETTFDPLTEFEKNTLAFCKAWIRGSNRFTLTTSGSTGPPKSITLTREQMVASALKVGKKLQLNNNDTALVCLDSRYIAGQMMLVRCFVFGMNVYAVTPSADPLSVVPENVPVHVASFVPYQLHAMLATKSLDRINKMRCILVGGAPIDSLLKKKIAALSCTVYATYGMTETAAAIAIQPLNGIGAQEYYQALPGVLISQNNKGCLVIKPDYLAKSVVTQDIVEMKGFGCFRWLGRSDNVINSGGIKVMPEKVEDAIQCIFDVLQLSNNFFIAGMPDEPLGERVCLIIEGDPFTSSVMQEIMKKIKAEKHPHTMPKEMQFVGQFTTTPSGKTDRIKTVSQIDQRSKSK